MALLIFLGGHMLLIPLPKSIRGSFYHRSLRTMGVAFLIVPASCFIYTQNNQLDLNPNFATAISLTAYFATFVLMSLALLMLLGVKFRKGVRRISAISVLVYPLPLWISIISGHEEFISTLTTASYTFFVGLTIVFVAIILRIYNRAAKNVDNFYSDDVIISVKWIAKSIRLLVGLTVVSLLAPIFFTYPHWLRLIFMVYGVLCYLHIHYGYRRMLINIAAHFTHNSHELAAFAIVEQTPINTAPIGDENRQHIHDQLEVWIADKKYVERGVTINSVAKEVCTNRTYLSRYINTTYNCSFRNWISQLRVAESKRILAEDIDISIYNVASTIGFASVESFTHIFTRNEGVPPTKWRERQK